MFRASERRPWCRVRRCRLVSAPQFCTGTALCDSKARSIATRSCGSSPIGWLRSRVACARNAPAPTSPYRARMKPERDPQPSGARQRDLAVGRARTVLLGAPGQPASLLLSGAPRSSPAREMPRGCRGLGSCRAPARTGIRFRARTERPVCSTVSARGRPAADASGSDDSAAHYPSVASNDAGSVSTPPQLAQPAPPVPEEPDMHEFELTQRFCVACMQPFELRGEASERRWECPGCGHIA